MTDLLENIQTQINQGYPNLYRADIELGLMPKLTIRYIAEHIKNVENLHQVTLCCIASGEKLSVVSLANYGTFHAVAATTISEICLDQIAQLKQSQPFVVQPAGSYHEIKSQFPIDWRMVQQGQQFSVWGNSIIPMNQVPEDVSEFVKHLLSLMAPLRDYAANDQYRTLGEAGQINDCHYSGC